MTVAGELRLNDVIQLSMCLTNQDYAWFIGKVEVLRLALEGACRSDQLNVVRWLVEEHTILHDNVEMLGVALNSACASGQLNVVR